MLFKSSNDHPMTKATIRNKGCARPQLGTSPSKAPQHRDIVELLNHKCFQYSHVFPALPRVGADARDPFVSYQRGICQGILNVESWGGALHVSWVEVLTWHCHALAALPRAFDILWHHPVNADETINLFIWTLLMGDLLGNAQWTDFCQDVRLVYKSVGVNERNTYATAIESTMTEFDRLCLGFTYLEHWTFAQYSQKKGKQCAEMPRSWRWFGMAPVWIRWANFSYREADLMSARPL